MKNSAVVLAVFVLCISCYCVGATLTVPAPYSIIQDAIDAAVSGDTIIVMEGTYVENIDMLGKSITLRSTDPENGVVVLATIIDGSGGRSVITCANGEGSNTVINGFLITNGTGTGPLGDGDGGGMYNYGSSPTISNCTFSGNRANYFDIIGVDGNGGGMYNRSSSPTISNCTFSGNMANKFGGGMYNEYSSSPTISNCTFSGNTVVWAGGGMYNDNASSPTVRNCVFSGNNANGSGGIGGDGGGMFNGESSPTISNCILWGNTADGKGGGMCNSSSSPEVSNCILWGNTAVVVGDEVFNSDASSVPNYMYCDIEGSGGSGAGWDTGLGTDGGGNIDADPLFVDAAAGYFYLKSRFGRLNLEGLGTIWISDSISSPCIDAGDPASDVGHEPAGNGGRINMGAYGGTNRASRSSYIPPIKGDIDGDGDVDKVDLAAFAENWLKSNY
jgi:parallel beta-helix repeat protein